MTASPLTSGHSIGLPAATLAAEIRATIPGILTISQKLFQGVSATHGRNLVLVRPINAMIEFQQVISRGTRLDDGKDDFTILDFVEAHHHFSDPEWDGEPIALVGPKRRIPPPKSDEDDAKNSTDQLDDGGDSARPAQ